MARRDSRPSKGFGPGPHSNATASGAAYTGEGAKTVLPSKAFAKISMRLVPDQSSAKIAKLFERHLKSIAPKTIDVKVRNLHGGEPAITPVDSPGVNGGRCGVGKGFGKKPLYQREGRFDTDCGRFQETARPSIPCCSDLVCRTRTRTRPTSSSTLTISSAASGLRRITTTSCRTSGNRRSRPRSPSEN